MSSTEVLVGMGALRAEDLEAWRFGRVPFLEKVILGNLSKLRRILRLIGLYCHDLNLVASSTAYARWGRGPRTPLRFTKTGEPKLERVYARHFVWPGKVPFHLPGRGTSRERESTSPAVVSGAITESSFPSAAERE